MNKLDEKFEKIYGSKANSAEKYDFEVGNKLYIVDTNRTTAPKIGTVGQITSIAYKDKEKIYRVLWDLKDGPVEGNLDPDDLVDLYLDPEIDIEIDKRFLQSFACPNCGKLVREAFVEILTLTRDLVIHQDCMQLSKFRGNEMALFDIYGGAENIKYYYVKLICPICRDEIELG